MFSVFTQPDVNTREVGRTLDKLETTTRSIRLCKHGYVNTETILYFFYKITNERGTKTVFTYAHVKWFYGQSERAYYLNYFIIQIKILVRNYKQIATLGDTFTILFARVGFTVQVFWRQTKSITKVSNKKKRIVVDRDHTSKKKKTELLAFIILYQYIEIIIVYFFIRHLFFLTVTACAK